jgi:YD repeat-containing protein
VQYHPDPSDLESYQYNRQQERSKLTDRNGTVHEFDYDGLGRQIADRVTALGTKYGYNRLNSRLWSKDVVAACAARRFSFQFSRSVSTSSLGQMVRISSS